MTNRFEFKCGFMTQEIVEPNEIFADRIDRQVNHLIRLGVHGTPVVIPTSDSMGRKEVMIQYYTEAIDYTEANDDERTVKIGPEHIDVIVSALSEGLSQLTFDHFGGRVEDQRVKDFKDGYDACIARMIKIFKNGNS